jgi:hypothetical protein
LTMSFERKPSKKTVEAMRIALGEAKDVGDDGLKALAIWRDFRWRLRMLDGTWETMVILVGEFIKRAEDELKSAAVKEQVLKRFEEMKTRLSEFNVEEDEDEL